MAPPTPQIDFLKGWPSPSLQPVAALKAATTTALSDPAIYVPALQYAPDGGYPPLRSAIATWLRAFYSRGCSSSAETIAISGGASQNLARLLQGFSDPVYTRNVWMVAPTYYLACRVFEDAGFAGKLRALAEDGEGVDVAALRKGLEESERKALGEGNTAPRIKRPRPENKIYKHIIYAVPTFANPSAKIITLNRREELVRLAREFDALVITDDVYDVLQWPVSLADQSSAINTTTTPNGCATFDFRRAIEPRIVDVDRLLDGGIERPGADGFGNAVSNGSFSKIIGPGVRCGWADGSERSAFALSQIGSTKSGGAPSQLVATFIAEMLKSGDVERHIYEVLQPAYARRYYRVISAIDRYLVPLGVEVGATGREEIAGGYFTWLILPVNVLAEDLTERAKLEENVVVPPGRAFQVKGDGAAVQLDHAIRLSFAYEDEGLLEEGIKRLAKVVSSMLEEMQG